MMNQNNAMVRSAALFTFAKHEPEGMIVTSEGKEIHTYNGIVERVCSVKDINARGKASIGISIFEHYRDGEYTGHVTWAKRVANVINAINPGADAFVGEGVWDMYGMFINPEYTPDCDHYDLIANVLIYEGKHPKWIVRKAKREMKDRASRRAYKKNPCRETAWVAIVGSNPEAWDF